MSRWQLQGTGDFYARYRAYENYLRANAQNLGLSQSQVEQQLGRYSAGLQQKLQYEPQNIAVGKDIAKNPAEYVINPNNVTTELEKTQKQLETLQKDLGKGATSTTYFGTPEQLKGAAPLGNVAPDVVKQSEFQKALEKSQLYKSTGGNSVDKLGKRKQKQILEEIENLGKLAKTDEEIAELQKRVAKFKGGNDQKLFGEAVEKQAAVLNDKVKETKISETKGPKIIFDDIREDTGKLKSEASAVDDVLDDAAKLKPEARAVEDVVDDAAKLKPQASAVDDVVDDAAKLKPEAEAASKESKGFLNTIKNAIKGKKGKVAIAAGAVAALGAGVYALFGSKGEENVEQAAMKAEPQQPEKTQPQKPESKTETPENLNQEKETQVVTNPQNQEEHQAKVNQQEETTPEKALVDVPKTETAAETESESAEGKVADEEYVIVKKGDSFWNLAKEHLIEKHKDESGYKPTNAEILELAMKFMEDNGYKLDENNYYPEPMLHPGVKLNLAM